MTPEYVYYWEDPGNIGYDVIARAKDVESARAIAREKLQGTTVSEDIAIISAALEMEPTGRFHHSFALWIFTECDPLESRLSRQEIDQLRARAEKAEAALAAAVGSTVETRWCNKCGYVGNRQAHPGCNYDSSYIGPRVEAAALAASEAREKVLAEALRERADCHPTTDPFFVSAYNALAAYDAAHPKLDNKEEANA